MNHWGILENVELLIPNLRENLQFHLFKTIAGCLEPLSDFGMPINFARLSATYPKFYSSEV